MLQVDLFEMEAEKFDEEKYYLDEISSSCLLSHFLEQGLAYFNFADILTSLVYIIWGYCLTWRMFSCSFSVCFISTL